MILEEVDLGSGSFRDANSIEMRATGGAVDLEDSFLDFITRGTASAATSAAVGLLNTGISFGVALGIGDEESFIDEGEAITNVFGERTGEFFQRHETGINAVGLVASSFVPGLAAIKALRVAQRAGKIPLITQAKTGLRNSDIVLGSKAVKAARISARDKRLLDASNPEVLRAYGAGVGQAFAESIAFDAAVAIGNNQNTLLNPDEDEFFTSAKNVFLEGLPFSFLGGVIGGGIEVLRVKGNVRKFVNDEFARTGKFAVPKLEGLTGNAPGDKLLAIAEAAEEHKELAKTIETSDNFAKARFETGQKTIRNRILDVAEEMGVKGKDQLKAIEDLMETAQAGNLDTVAKVLSGMSKVGNVTKTDFNKAIKFFDRVPGPSAIVRGNTPEEIAEEIGRRQQDFKTALEDLELGEAAEFITPTQFKVTIGNFLKNDPNFSATQGSVTRAAPGIQQVPEFNISVQSLDGTKNSLGFVPDYVSLNPQSIEAGFKATKAWARNQGREFNMTLEEFGEATLLHELGHVKANSTKMMNLVGNQLAFGKNRENIRGLVELSIGRRRKQWEAGMFGQTPTGLKNRSDSEIADEVLEFFDNPNLAAQPGFMHYLGSPAELLADGAAAFADKATREIAAKRFPKLARFFNSNSGITKAWSPEEAFLNVRTQEVVTSAIFGINDISRGSRVVKDALNVPELNTTFKRAPNAFDDIINRVNRDDFNILDIDAQWNLVARMELKNLLPKNASAPIEIGEFDLPMMERIFQEASAGNLAGKEIRIGDKVVSSAKEIENTLTSTKATIRDALITTRGNKYINEEKLKKILNVSDEFAAGNNSGQAITFGTKDFSSPEFIKASFRHDEASMFKQSSLNLAASKIRRSIIESERQRVSSTLIGKSADALPSRAPMEKIFSLSPAEQRTTLIGGLRPDFGSLREFAAFMGKQNSQLKANAIAETEADFVPFIEKFNKRGNENLRMELAQVDNIARRQWFYKARFRSGDGSLRHALVNKHTFLEEFSKLYRDAEPDLRLLDDMPEDLVSAVRGIQREGDNALMEISNDIGDYIDFRIEENKGIVRKKRRIAKLNGKESVWDDDVYYAPPPDLRKQKFQAFIVPTEAMKGSDPRQFMAFGKTADELQEKINLVNSKYPGLYNVITQKDDINQFKRLMGEFDQDLVFDEIFFDAQMARKGKASELFTNLDIDASSTIDRHFSWSVRQKEALIDEGFKTKYADMFETLQNLDREYGKIGRSSLEKRYREPDSIFKDTANIMLGRRSVGSRAEQEFVRINDFIGDVGSKAVDNAVGFLRRTRTGSVTEEGMKAFNDSLQKRGILAPTRNAMEAVLSSPNIKSSTTLNEMVRTLSNMVSLSMLRMDPAHSMLQVLSTPVLALPVLRELQTSLRGPAKKQLDDMTSVINPASGLREPTPAKLFFEGTQKFFTEEGKEFLGQMRDRNIISDYLIQYLNDMDFSEFTGNHTLKQVGNKVDRLALRLSKVSGFTFTEEFTRFQVAWAAKRMAEIGGKTQDELWPIVNSSVDKVHGVFQGTQRPQIFKGVLGQAMGLYQSYFFNFMQNMMKFSELPRDRKSLLTQAAMQTSMFGVQSWTGFETLNTLIAETNSDRLDLFEVTGADDPKSLSSYFMYGLGSHSLGVPIDFYVRGDLAARQATILPTNVADFPVVSTIAKASRNLVNTGKLLSDALTDGTVPVGEVLLEGLAHNGLNRPLGGIANIIRNRTTSRNGQTQWDNITFTGDSIWDAEDIHFGSIFARAIGARPLDESIATNAFFREAKFDANQRREMIKIGQQVKLNVAAGTLGTQTFDGLAKKAEENGVDVQSFNAFWARQLQNASTPTIQEFRDDMERSRSYERMLRERQQTTPWEIRNQEIPSILPEEQG